MKELKELATTNNEDVNLYKTYLNRIENFSLNVILYENLYYIFIQAASARLPDPYGCRLKVRTELGIAPHMGPSYPGFWDKVDRCLKAAQGGADAKPVRSTQTPERPDKKPVAAAKADKPAPATEHLKSSPGESDVHSAALPSSQSSPASAPVAASRPIPDYGRRVALVIGNGHYTHVPALANAIAALTGTRIRRLPLQHTIKIA